MAGVWSGSGLSDQSFRWAGRARPGMSDANLQPVGVDYLGAVEGQGDQAGGDHFRLGDEFAVDQAVGGDQGAGLAIQGLGAPVGSALVGPRELIMRAHRWRKMLGGGMRQSGLLAAAALHALEHHIDRLAEDHALAQRLASGLQGLPGLTVEPPQTNIVFADLQGERAAGLMAHLKARGVLATGLYKLRFVTHLDVDAAGVDRAIAAVREHLFA